MSDKDMRNRLLSDLTCLGLPMNEVDLVFRPYSKTFFGRYYPMGCKKNMERPRVLLYPYEQDGSFMEYQSLLDTVVHEMVHHIQYTSGSFTRRSGIMHNPQFWQLYNHYVKRAVRYGLLTKKGSVCYA